MEEDNTKVSTSSDQSQKSKCVDRLIISKNISIFDYPFDAYTAFSLIFEYLNFFDFTNLDKVSEDFQKLSEEHLNHKYKRVTRRRQLFKNFNLEYFLFKVDHETNTEIMVKPKPITMMELKFIFNVGWFLVESVSVDTEYLSELSPDRDHLYYAKDVFQEINRFIEWKKIKFININGQDHATKSVFNRSPIIDLQRDISFKELQSLAMNKAIRELSVLTDYKEANVRNLLIQYLRSVQIGELCVKGASGFLNRNCDEILDAIGVKNSNSFQLIKIESCHSYKLFRMLSKFKNLNEVILDNVSYFGPLESSDTDLSMVRELIITNCSIIDDSALRILLTHYFPNVNSVLISNCENVDGSFLYEIERNPSNNLKVDLTYLNTEFAPKINVEEISNGIICSRCNYAPYSEELILNAIASFEDTFADNCEHRKPMMPYGFGNVLKRYYRSGMKFHLDLRHFSNMNEHCLKYILKSLPYIEILSLNIYYTRIKTEKLDEFLQELSLTEIRISGFKYADILDEQNCCDHIINALIQSKSQNVPTIEITDCSLGIVFKELNKRFKIQFLTLQNVRFCSSLTQSQIHFPTATEITINNCLEENDKMCIDQIRNYEKLYEFHLSGCNNVTGSFLSTINKFNDTWIFIADAPRIFTFIKEASEIPELTEKNRLYMNLVSKTGDKQSVTCFDEKFFKNLVKFRYLHELTMSTSYPNVHDWKYLCHLRVLYLLLINDKFHEHDATIEILNNFAVSQVGGLERLTLKMCKIDERVIKTINRLGRIKFLSFESMRGLSKKLIKALSVNNQNGINLEIIDHEELDDDTCFEIIKKLRLMTLNVTKCKNITEILIEEINSVDKKISLMELDISGTYAGYYQLSNSLFLIDPNKKLLNFSRGVNFNYLQRIFDQSQKNRETITKLPEILIQTFSGGVKLDLRDLPELTDLAFELVSQLNELETLEIRANYVNVRDRRSISGNILKMNLQTLLLQGYGYGNESLSLCYILEPFCYITNSLQEIHFVNCSINRELIESLCSFNEFSVFRVSNEETILHR